MINKSDLPKFNPDVYTKITLNNLVVYSIYFLHNKNAEVKSEDIISACFMLFPKRFFLRKHPHWPDSAMVSRHWGVCRSKGYIAAGTEPGFKLTAKGVRLAEKVAKVLGMAIPKQAAKVQPSRPTVRAITPAGKVQPVVREEKATLPAPAKKIQLPRSKVRAVRQAMEAGPVQKEKVAPPAPIKKVYQVRSKKVSSAKKEKVVLQPVVVKTRSSRSKARVVTQVKKAQSVQKEKTTLPAPIKKMHPVRSKKVSPAKKVKTGEIAQKKKAVLPPAVRNTQPPRSKVRPATQVQTTQPVPTRKITPPRPARKVRPVPPARTRPTTSIKNVRPIWTKKIKPPQPVVRSVIVEKTQLTQPEKAIHPAVTQEIKVRAGKYVRAIETSDAYIHYKKNGKSSKISEFDFRSLLLCTMESSPETLARNVEQFKGYANIHNRQDLVVFLNFCADKLSYLLVPQTRQSTQRTTK